MIRLFTRRGRWPDEITVERARTGLRGRGGDVLLAIVRMPVVRCGDRLGDSVEIVR